MATLTTHWFPSFSCPEMGVASTDEVESEHRSGEDLVFYVSDRW